MNTFLRFFTLSVFLWSNILFAGFSDVEKQEIEFLIGSSEKTQSSALFDTYLKFVKENVVSPTNGWKEIVSRSKYVMNLIHQKIQTVNLERSGLFLKELNVLVIEVSATGYYHYLDNEYKSMIELLYDKIKLAESKSSLNTFETMYLAKMKIVRQALTSKKDIIDVQTNEIIKHVREWSALEFFLHRYTIPEGTLEHRYVSLLDYEEAQAKSLIAKTKLNSLLGEYIKVFAKSFNVGSEEVLFRFSNYFKRNFAEELKEFFNGLAANKITNDFVVGAAMDFDLLVGTKQDYQSIFLNLTQGGEYPALQEFIVNNFDERLKHLMESASVVENNGRVKLLDMPKISQIYSSYQELLSELIINKQAITLSPTELVSSYSTNYIAMLYLTPKPWLFENSDFTKIEWAIEKFKSFKSYYEMVHVLGEISGESEFLFKFLYATDNKKLRSSLQEYIDVHANIHGWKFSTEDHLKEVIFKYPERLKEIFVLESIEQVDKGILTRIYDGTVDAFKNAKILNGCNFRLINLN